MVCCKFTTESANERIFENWLTCVEVMGESLVSCFLTHGVYLRCVLSDQFDLQYTSVTND